MSGSFQRRTLETLACLAVLATVSTSARAADGRIPIPFTSPPTTPITITAPGSYVLTRNITAPANGQPVISITMPASGDVDLDLNGFTLDGSATSENISVSFPAGANGGVRIHDGSVNGGAQGINIIGPPSPGLRRAVIERLRIGNMPVNSLSMRNVVNGVVRDCTIHDGGLGIFSDATVAPNLGTLTVERNQIWNTRGGISVSNATMIIRNNEVAQVQGGGTFLWGIAIDTAGTGSLVAENTIRSVVNGTGGDGLQLRSTSSGIKVFDNVITGCSGNGIRVFSGSNDNLLLRNVVSGSTGSGIYVAGSRNHIEANVMNSNGRGLTLDLPAGALNNVYRANTARGNTGAFACPGGPCSGDFCGFGVPANNTEGDNYMPATAAAPPACEK